MPTLRFKSCDYDCSGKGTERGFRVYCRKMDKNCKPRRNGVQIPTPLKKPWDAEAEIASSGRIKRVVDMEGKTVPRRQWKGIRIMVFGPRIAQEVIEHGGIAIDFTQRKRWIILGNKIVIENSEQGTSKERRELMIRNLMVVVRTMVENAGAEGETFTNLMHTFKDYDPSDIRVALTKLLHSEQIKEPEYEVFVSADVQAKKLSGTRYKKRTPYDTPPFKGGLGGCYDVEKNPHDKKWYVIGNMGRGYWMPVSSGYKTKAQATTYLHRQVKADIAARKLV